MSHSWMSSRRAIEEVLRAAPDDRRFHYPVRHGTMRVGLYAPRGFDAQTPHSQDELYIIAGGSGRFRRNRQWIDVAEGDVLFVPAGMEHHFADLSADFRVWVVFWGPDGGE